jgi:hypothetical protein
MERKCRIGISLSLVEKEALKKLAYIEGGLSMAALLRRLIRQSAVEKGIWKMIINLNNQESGIKANNPNPYRFKETQK